MTLIVTGCPRSGTTTAARVFGMLHEEQFSAAKAALSASDGGLMLQSECAWPAAPFARRLLARGMAVVHLVRNPLHTIPSMMQRQLLARDGGVRAGNDQFIRRHIQVPNDGTMLEKCTVLWVRWNSMLSDLDLPRIRIEDIVNAPRLHEGPPTEPLMWADIPTARTLAREYGYD